MKPTAAESILVMMKPCYNDRTESKSASLDEGFARALQNHLSGRQEESEKETVTDAACLSCRAANMDSTTTQTELGQPVASTELSGLTDMNVCEDVVGIPRSEQGSDRKSAASVAANQSDETGHETGFQSMLDPGVDSANASVAHAAVKSNAISTNESAMPVTEDVPASIVKINHMDEPAAKPAVELQKTDEKSAAPNLALPGESASEAIAIQRLPGVPLAESTVNGIAQPATNRIYEAIVDIPVDQLTLPSTELTDHVQSAPADAGSDLISQREKQAISESADRLSAFQPAASNDRQATNAAVLASIHGVGLLEQAPTDLLQTGWNTDASDVTGPATLPESMNAPQQAVASILMMMRAQRQEMRLRLYPDHLGEIHIRLTKDHNGLNAILTADRPDACALLEQNLDLLRQTLADKQIPCRTIEVRQSTLTEHTFDAMMAGDPHGQSSGQSPDQASTDLAGNTTGGQKTQANPGDPTDSDQEAQAEAQRTLQFGFDRTV